MLEIYNEEENVKPDFFATRQEPQVKYEAGDDAATENIKAVETDDNTQAPDDYPYNMLSESLW